MPTYAKRKAKGIKAIVLDVDGTLTDGSIYMTPQGDEIKRFNVKDGMGVNLAIRAGLLVAILSGRTSEAVSLRARELGIKEVHQGVKNKMIFFEKIKEKFGLKEEEICFVGDDLNDLPLMRRVGLPICVPESPKVVQEACVYKTFLPGGGGAVREVIDLILNAQGFDEKLLSDDDEG